MTLLVAFVFPFLLAGAGAIVAGRKGAWAVFAIHMTILVGGQLLLSPVSAASLEPAMLFWLSASIAYLAACSYLAGRFVADPQAVRRRP
jgi:hypothetical protein